MRWYHVLFLILVPVLLLGFLIVYAMGLYLEAKKTEASPQVAGIGAGSSFFNSLFATINNAISKYSSGGSGGSSAAPASDDTATVTDEQGMPIVTPTEYADDEDSWYPSDFVTA